MSAIALVRYDAARAALAEAHRVDEVKDIRDKAHAVAAYARQANDTEMVEWATEIKVRAERRAGELLDEMKQRGQRQGPGGDRKSSFPRGSMISGPSLGDLGISEKQSARWQKLAQVSEPEFEQAVQAAKEVAREVTTTAVLRYGRESKEREREQRREHNRTKIAETPAPGLLVGAARFATIVIDPPWDWGDEGDQDQLGRARPTYGTMPFAELMDLPVPDLADTDCHLYLWITNRSLPKGFALLEEWGFRYVTCLTWCKPSFGMGNYFRGSTEHLLFGVKGSQMLARRDVGTWFAAPRGKGHSAKPHEAYALIESCSPGPYLEMFARAQRDGWSVWGAEADADAA